MDTDNRLLKKEILKKRASKSIWERKEASDKICVRLMQMEAYKKAGRIFAFVPFGSEVDITPVLYHALLEGKKLFLPKIMDENTMEFFETKDMLALKEGYHGILEPDSMKEPYYRQENSHFTDDFEQELMLTPGSIFDKTGNRMGYGKGFYDKFFARMKPESFYKIGICFSCQIVEQLHGQKETDILVDRVLCEQGFVK